MTGKPELYVRKRCRYCGSLAPYINPERLRFERLRRGSSLEHVAFELGISPDTVRKAECGTRRAPLDLLRFYGIEPLDRTTARPRRVPE